MPKRDTIRINSTPQIKEVRKGYFSIRFRLPKAAGKSQSERFYVEGTLRDAKRAAEKYREQLEDELNNVIIRDDVTFGEYARAWHDARKDGDELNEVSWEREETTIRNIENSCINDILLTDLTTEDIDELKQEGIKKRYSNDKQRRILAKTKQILNFAVERRRIKYNPADPVKQVKLIKNERRSLTEEEQRRLIVLIANEEMSGRMCAIRLSMALGLRRGEALGLQWGDVNFEKQFVDIKRQLNSKGKYEQPKQASFGRIPIDEGTLDFLQDWKEEQSRLFLDGEEQSEDTPICTNLHGEAYDPNNFSKWFCNYMVEQGFAEWEETWETRDAKGHKREHARGYHGIRFHELRHTVATELLALGADLRSVQELMRHKSINTTARYIHAIPDNMRDAMEKLGEKRERPMKDESVGTPDRPRFKREPKRKPKAKDSYELAYEEWEERGRSPEEKLAQKREAYTRQGGRCSVCLTPTEFEEMQVNLIVPLKDGGYEVADNMELTCAKCNRKIARAER